MVALQELQGCPSLLCSSTEVGGQAGVAFENRLNQLIPRLIKRTFDIVVAGGALLVLSPALLTFALIIKLTSPGPVLYSQPRYGYLGKKFRMWKFRTMIQNADKVLEEYFQKNPSLRQEYEIHHKLANDPRITSIGKFLRKASIDEIPQLWNVLVGQMSIVGPRPILLDELDKYGDVFPIYCRVTPGITGLWQVNGRNQAAYETRLIYATYYVRNWSVWMDCYILLKSVRVVLFCEGAC
jgi:Undecaprenyl-phosphate galactose phosphotransferase WbaP